MTLEERLIGCNILHTDNTCRAHCCNLVDQLHGIAMRKQFANTLVIHDWHFIRIIDWRLNFMLANFFSHQSCKLIIDSMTRSGRNNSALDRFADKRHVTDDIKQFMTCALIFPHQWLVLNISNLRCIHVRNFQNIGQLVKFLLAHFTFIDNNGIVKVATFDKVCLQQRNDVAYKHECSCCSNLRVESRHILQGGKLTVDKLGVK